MEREWAEEATSHQSLGLKEQEDPQASSRPGNAGTDAAFLISRLRSVPKENDSSHLWYGEHQSSYPKLPRAGSNESMASQTSDVALPFKVQEAAGGDKKKDTEYWLRNQLQPHLSSQKSLQDIEDFYRYRHSSKNTGLRGKRTNSKSAVVPSHQSVNRQDLEEEKKVPEGGVASLSHTEESAEDDELEEKGSAGTQSGAKSAVDSGLHVSKPVATEPGNSAEQVSEGVDVGKVPEAKRWRSEPVRHRDTHRLEAKGDRKVPHFGQPRELKQATDQDEHIPIFKDARMPSDGWELGSEKTNEQSEDASTTTREAQESMELRKSQSDAMAELKKFSFRLDTKLANLENRTKHWNRARSQLKIQVHRQHKVAHEALKDLKAQLTATQEFLENEEKETKRLWEIAAQVRQRSRDAETRMEDLSERISDQTMLADAQRNAHDRLHKAMKEINSAMTAGTLLSRMATVAAFLSRASLATLRFLWEHMWGKVKRS